MKNKTKRVYWGFFSLDYKAMGEYLEEMAEKGWMVEKVGRYTAKFRAIEPKKIKVYVDVFKEGGTLTPDDNKELVEYRKLCQESGWTFITSINYLQFFYAAGDIEPVPIQTDEEIEQKIVEHTLLKNELRGILIFSIIAVYILVRNIPLRYTNLLSFTGVTSTFLFPLLYIFNAVPAVYSIIWMIKARRNIKNGLSIAKPTLKSARRRIRAFNGSVWIIVLIFLLSFIADAFFKPDIVPIAMLGPIIGIIIGSGIRYLIKKNKVQKEDVIIYSVLAIVAIVIFSRVIIAMVIEGKLDIGKFENPYIVDSIPEDYPIITIKEISKESSPGSEISIEFIPGMSPIVPKNYNYWEDENINGNRKSINIKYYEAINPYFAEFIFKGIKAKLEEGIRFKGMLIFTKTVITDDEMRKLWDVDNIGLVEETKEIIIQKGNIVLYLDYFSVDMDFNDTETRELVISRFFR